MLSNQCKPRVNLALGKTLSAHDVAEAARTKGLAAEVKRLQDSLGGGLRSSALSSSISVKVN